LRRQEARAVTLPSHAFHFMSSGNSHTIWTRAFVLLCGAQFLGYASHSMLAPALPLYVTQLGGSPFMVGLVLAAFAVTSVIVRPLVGHWVDRWSDAGVMNWGLLFQGASIFFCFLPFAGAVMLANGLRGIGWAGLNAGGYTLLALTAPETRRGEASGLYSGVQGSPAILFPALALWLIAAPFGGFAVVFAVTALFPFVGAAVGGLISRHLPRPVGLPLSKDSTPWWRQIFRFVEREVFLPSLLLFWLNLALPAFNNFSVLYARELGLSNFAPFFVVVGLTSLLGRPLLGRLSDRIGRSRSIAAGLTLQVVGLLLITMVANLFGMICAGALFMAGNAIGSSTTLAFAVERADPTRRGKAMATFSMAYPLSYGLGSLLIGSTVESAGYVGMYLILAALEAVGLIFMLLYGERVNSNGSERV
jgi:MFS family permease